MKNLVLVLVLFSSLAFADNNKEIYQFALQRGCDSGGKPAGNWLNQYKKDTQKYLNNVYYKAGWDDGFAECKAIGEKLLAAKERARDTK